MADRAAVTAPIGARPGRLMQIGEVAELIGLSLRTIRWYGEVGVAPPTARSDGGFRLYSERDVDRLRVVMQMKPLGFSLEEMRVLLDALDRVRAASHAAAAAAAVEQLAGFHEAATVRVRALRAELVTAERFAAGLAAELHQPCQHCHTNAGQPRDRAGPDATAATRSSLR